MKTYDSSKGKRGPVNWPEPKTTGKTRITIRLDEDILDHFMGQADQFRGKVGYQTLINEALRRHMNGQSPTLEAMLRRVIREEKVQTKGS